jgi:hypothetical protein
MANWKKDPSIWAGGNVYFTEFDGETVLLTKVYKNDSHLWELKVYFDPIFRVEIEEEDIQKAKKIAIEKIKEHINGKANTQSV